MSYYRTCPRCGANLDPGEQCDCASPAKSQPIVNLQKKAARCANTEQPEKTPHDT